MLQGKCIVGNGGSKISECGVSPNGLVPAHEQESLPSNSDFVIEAIRIWSILFKLVKRFT
jgi:hypothetical protein